MGTGVCSRAGMRVDFLVNLQWANNGGTLYFVYAGVRLSAHSSCVRVCAGAEKRRGD